jgi:hypothetical protein
MFGVGALDRGMRIAISVAVFAACRTAPAVEPSRVPEPLGEEARRTRPNCMFDEATHAVRICEHASDTGECLAFGDPCGVALLGENACLYDPETFDYRICQDLREDGLCYR